MKRKKLILFLANKIPEPESQLDDKGEIVYSSTSNILKIEKIEEEERGTAMPRLKIEEVNLEKIRNEIYVKENHVLDSETQKFNTPPQESDLKRSIKKANSSRKNIDILNLITTQREEYLTSRKGLFQASPGLSEDQIMRSSSRNLRTVDGAKVQNLINKSKVKHCINNIQHKLKKHNHEHEFKNEKYYSSLVFFPFKIF